jgi:hypothetical protein
MITIAKIPRDAYYISTDKHKGINMESITINGQDYDPVTGLPRDGEKKAVEQSQESHIVVHHHTPASHLHATPQRSITLHRKVLKKPSHKIIKHETAARAEATLHPEVRKFAPHPVGAIQPKKLMDIGPTLHPHVAKAHAKSAAKAASLSSHLPTAAEKKEKAVRSAVAETHKKAPLRSRLQPRQRVAAVMSAVFALVLLGAYLTYLNMPSLSVRVAAAQAGINASYPDYRPDGYSLTGPVTYSDSRVSMNFKANGGNHGFSLNQSKSSWNSEAVLDNYVTPRAGSSYIPYTEHGLTIYAFDANAAWVNGGILYTIEGDAPLSSEQIRRIATSLL